MGEGGAARAAAQRPQPSRRAHFLPPTQVRSLGRARRWSQRRQEAHAGRRSTAKGGSARAPPRAGAPEPPTAGGSHDRGAQREVMDSISTQIIDEWLEALPEALPQDASRGALALSRRSSKGWTLWLLLPARTPLSPRTDRPRRRCCCPSRLLPARTPLSPGPIMSAAAGCVFACPPRIARDPGWRASTSSRSSASGDATSGGATSGAASGAASGATSGATSATAVSVRTPHGTPRDPTPTGCAAAGRGWSGRAPACRACAGPPRGQKQRQPRRRRAALRASAEGTNPCHVHGSLGPLHIRNPHVSLRAQCLDYVPDNSDGSRGATRSAARRPRLARPAVHPWPSAMPPARVREWDTSCAAFTRTAFTNTYTYRTVHVRVGVEQLTES